MARITRTIDAEQWTGDNLAAIVTLAGQAMQVDDSVIIAVVRSANPANPDDTSRVKPMVARPGDWIVKARGDLSVKADVTFQEQYGPPPTRRG